MAILTFESPYSIDTTIKAEGTKMYFRFLFSFPRENPKIWRDIHLRSM